jgi:hypothetical protein
MGNLQDGSTLDPKLTLGRPGAGVGAVPHRAGRAASKRAMFDRVIAAPEAITLEQWQRRPLSMRMQETLARLWV